MSRNSVGTVLNALRQAGRRIGATTRRGLVFTLLFTAAGGMLARAAYLQVVHKDFLQDQGDDRYLRTVEVLSLIHI